MDKKIRVCVIGHCGSGKTESIKHLLESEIGRISEVIIIEPENIKTLNRGDILVSPERFKSEAVLSPDNTDPKMDSTNTLFSDSMDLVCYSSDLNEKERINIPVKKKKKRLSRIERNAMYGGGQ